MFKLNFSSKIIQEDEVFLRAGKDVMVLYELGGAVCSLYMTDSDRAIMVSYSCSIVSFCLSYTVSEILRFSSNRN